MSSSLPGSIIKYINSAITGTESVHKIQHIVCHSATDSESQTADRTFSIAITVSIGEGG